MDPLRVRSILVAPELLLVAGCVATVVLWSLPPMLGVWIGAAMSAGSLAGGAVAGAVYHVRLHQALAPMPRGWLWNPTREHPRLSPAQRRAVMPWFLAGAMGFAGAMVGAVAFLSAALRL